MTDLEMSRLQDFKKILTYHLVSKINYKYGFNKNYVAYYKAPYIWQMWKNGKVKYAKPIFKYLALFNATSLSRNQVKAIFGKDENNIPISYVELLKQDNEITSFNKGTIVIKGVRHQIAKRYQLPFDYIKSIFEDQQLLEKVLDATSDFYTKRQRKLIFNQIVRKKQQKIINAFEQKQVKELMKVI